MPIPRLARSLAIPTLSTLFVAIVLLSAEMASAHFGLILPSTEAVDLSAPKTLRLELRFLHPFEYTMLQMPRPTGFNLTVGGKRTDLLGTLKPLAPEGAGWSTEFKVRRPGDHIFVLETAPYYEPEEDLFIVHIAKTIVSGLNLSEAWMKPLGLKAEIVPISRPYGLWAGNVLQGRVLFKGKPAAWTQVEVEYLNTDKSLKAPYDAYITQVVMTDSDGVFTYAMPRAGWWGFAALGQADYMLESPGGKRVPVELGAVLWVRTREMQ